MKRPFKTGRAAVLASAALLLGPGWQGAARAGSLNNPLQGAKGAAPGVPGLPVGERGLAPLDRDLAGTPETLGVRDAASGDPTPTLQAAPAESQANVLPEAALPATVSEGPADAHHRPAAAEPRDLGSAASVDAPATPDAADSAGDAAQADGLAGMARTVLAAVSHNPVVRAIVSGLDPQGDQQKRLYEGSRETGADETPASAGGSGPTGPLASGLRPAESKASLGPLGFDGRRRAFPFLPDAWALNARDLERTVGPAAAARMAEEAAAREAAERIDGLLKRHYARIKGSGPKDEPLAPADEELVLRTMRHWGEHGEAVAGAKAAVAAAPAEVPEAKLAPWRELWTSEDFRRTVRTVLADGRYYTPLSYRRFLLGLGVSEALTRQRLAELAGDFVQQLDGRGLLLADQQRAAAEFSALKALQKKSKGQAPAGLAAARAENDRFAEFTAALDEFGPYIREAVDLILLAAPDDRDLQGFASDVLARAGRVLAPALRAEPGRRLASFDGEGRRQLFFETLLKTLFPDYRLEFRIGLGGSDDVPSIRLFSYVIPALNQMRAFAANGVRAPELVIFNAQPLSASVNGLNPEVSRRNAELANESLRTFIRRFYPDLAGSVRIEMRSLEEVRRHPFEDNIAHLRALAADPSASRDAHKKVLLRDLSAMRERALRHGGLDSDEAADRNAFTYVAAHPGPGVFGDIQLAGDLDDGRMPPPHAVVEWGGGGETRFKRLQLYLANLHPTAAGSSTYLPNTAFGAGGPGSAARARAILAEMAVGTNPPYYHREGGGAAEITLSGTRARLAALGIRTAQDLLAYYRTNFTRDLNDDKGQALVDRTIPFDVEVLVREVGAAPLMRFLEDLEPQ